MNRYEGTGHAPGGYTSLGSLKSSMQNFYQQEINDVPTDNQIGFDIQPRERPYKLP